LPVLLFDVALLVASPGTPEGYGDVFLLTERHQLHVNKLCSVVCVEIALDICVDIAGNLGCNGEDYDSFLEYIEKTVNEFLFGKGSNITNQQSQ
jgi:uncharacterized protein YutE (UPF0331/DUF86 family)